MNQYVKYRIMKEESGSNSMSQCKIEIIDGHIVSYFTENGDSDALFLPKGLKSVGNYLYETACGSFAAVLMKVKLDLISIGTRTMVESRCDNATFILEADKIKILPEREITK